MRRQELLDEAARHQRRVSAQQEASVPHRSSRLWAAFRSLRAELVRGIGNASLERPQPGPPGIRDGLR
jgi:hypothetical protein